MEPCQLLNLTCFKVKSNLTVCIREVLETNCELPNFGRDSVVNHLHFHSNQYE